MLVPIRKGERVIGVLLIQNRLARLLLARAIWSCSKPWPTNAAARWNASAPSGQLRESEQRFRDLFENSPDAIFVEDLDGMVLDVNLAGCVLHGTDARAVDRQERR